MKTLVIVSIIVLVVMIIAQSFVSNSTNKTESHAYEVLKVYNDFEVRKYQPALFSGVKLPSKSYKKTSSMGFRVLAGYIFGNNNRNEKIAMTTPVVMKMGDTTEMFFKVPEGYTIEELPQPTDSNIVFAKQSEKIMAAIRFSGWANDDKIQHYTSILKGALYKEKIEHTGHFRFLGYNPPYELVNRRNEVAVELLNYNN